MILKSVILTVSSLGGYWYLYIITKIFLPVCLLHIAPWLWLDHFEQHGGTRLPN